MATREDPRVSEVSAGAEAGRAAVFAAERPRLVGLAYRLLGSLADAEDVVQEAWFRWERADTDAIERPAAWLTTVVSRIGLDLLRARQRDRAEYVGPWLPEPLVERLDVGPDPADAAELSDSLTTAFLLMLEALAPVERLVLLLADVFDEPFASISEIAGKSEAACRQIAVRARRKLQGSGLRRRPSLAEQRTVASTFALAALAGDRDAMLQLLSSDIVLISDGGAKRHAARRPVVTPQRVTRLVINIAQRVADHVTVEPVLVNGAYGLFLRYDGKPYSIQSFEIEGGKIVRITSVLNPEKLEAAVRAVELV
jgi:RNA polymerase sigma-70 factor (ECF subfamily)